MKWWRKALNHISIESQFMFLNKIRWKADKQEHLIGFYVFYSSDK